MHHIRAAFDPKSAAVAAANATKAESGKVYCCGATEFAAGGVPPTAKSSAQLRTPHLLTTILEQQVVQLSCGWRHSALVTADGQLFVCGDNEYGKLGIGDLVPRPTPMPVAVGVRVSQVSCGHSHTGFVCTMGDAYTMGLNLYGQLGHGSLVNTTSVQTVKGVGGAAAAISCGGLHTLVLRADGRALSCGFSDAGRLGRTLEGNALCAEWLAPIPLNGAASSSDGYAVVSVNAGGAHTALVLADGSVYTCGRGESGQLGHGSTASEPHPRRIVSLKASRVRRAALGEAHTLLLTSAGVPYVCGCGGFGRLGLGGRAAVAVPTPITSLSGRVIVQISAGSTHSAFTTEEGGVFTCGV